MTPLTALILIGKHSVRKGIDKNRIITDKFFEKIAHNIKSNPPIFRTGGFEN